MNHKSNVCISGYEVSFEPITDHLAQKLSKQEMQTYIDLVEKAQHEPRKALHSVIAFKDRHPDLPEALNLLAFVYTQLKYVTRAEELILETYEKNPDYLFAKINYADQTLRHKKSELVPTIFNHTFELRDLFPERKVFHYSEFRGFMVIMGFYHLAIGDKPAARNYYNLAMQVDPGHLSVWSLEKRLFRFKFLKKFMKLVPNLKYFQNL